MMAMLLVLIAVMGVWGGHDCERSWLGGPASNSVEVGTVETAAGWAASPAPSLGQQELEAELFPLSV